MCRRTTSFGVLGSGGCLVAVVVVVVVVVGRKTLKVVFVSKIGTARTRFTAGRTLPFFATALTVELSTFGRNQFSTESKRQDNRGSDSDKLHLD